MVEIAKAHNIGRSTLDVWVKKYRDNGTISNQKESGSNHNASTSEKFDHLVETASLDEEALGIYCRAHGLYSFQLTQWKSDFMTPKELIKKQEKHEELNSLRVENKQLKQEVRRKDSALAEATALLILKKKAALIWGEAEDDPLM